MKKYLNIDYHHVSMHEFQKVLEDITSKDELYMKQFVFIHTAELSPYFRIEFANLIDHEQTICVYIDFPATVPVTPYEVISKMESLITELQRFDFRHCYPEFQCYKCDSNDNLTA